MCALLVVVPCVLDTNYNACFFVLSSTKLDSLQCARMTGSHIPQLVAATNTLNPRLPGRSRGDSVRRMFPITLETSLPSLMLAPTTSSWHSCRVPTPGLEDSSTRTLLPLHGATEQRGVMRSGFEVNPAEEYKHTWPWTSSLLDSGMMSTKMRKFPFCVITKVIWYTWCNWIEMY